VELAIDISSARTVGDVLDLINDHPDNQDSATAVTARLRPLGNGIELVDGNLAGTEPLSVHRVLASRAAWDLGLVPVGADQSLPAAGGTPATIQGADVNPIETQGVFNSLIRLYEAVETFHVEEIERIVGMLDEDFDRLNFGRAELGARGQGLDAITARNEDEQVELSAVLSQEIDMDLAEAASDFAARQAAYEASLRSVAALYRLSLLDFM
jgi:flagellar hook-associated protein 3 FlgL